MKIRDKNIVNVLANSHFDANKLFLPNQHLERKLYVAVNKVLEAIGGKWNRKERAHLFEYPPADIVEHILLTGEYVDQKKEFQFFETPRELAKQLVGLAGIREAETVLEPSAGRGAIAQFLNGCDCIELNEANRGYLEDKGFNVVGEDFLAFNNKYDVIVANPPFTKQQDIDHVLHMLKLANRKVVSVMSASVLFRNNHKTIAFRSFIEEGGATIKPLPDGTFSPSGTNVRTCVFCYEVIK